MARAVAAITASAVIELLAATLVRRQVQFHDHLGRWLELGPAVLADLADEALGEDRLERRGDEERLEAHVSHARDRTGGVVRVQRAEHDVPREGGLNRDLGRLEIA